MPHGTVFYGTLFVPAVCPVLNGIIPWVILKKLKGDIKRNDNDYINNVNVNRNVPSKGQGEIHLSINFFEKNI